MTFTEAQVRKINLIEVLKEDAEESGRPVSEPPEAAINWTEDEIRMYFKTGEGPVVHARIPPADEATFRKWFPGLEPSKTACGADARMRVLCFPNAGNAEDMYSGEGTGVRRAPSPLLEWCRANHAECLAVQPPGRAMRLHEPCAASCQDLAAALLPVVASKLYDTPYVIVAHSVGTWVAYEFMRLCAVRGLPQPRRAFLSAMASPDIPVDRRPWRQQRTLDEPQFKEECRGWDVNELVFSPAMWGTYHPLMRADFTLFDEYCHTHKGEPPFDFPLTCFWGSRDRRITKDMVQGWSKFTTGAFSLSRVEGNHLWPLDKEPKGAWLAVIASGLAGPASS